jgi:hypothetical protein
MKDTNAYRIVLGKLPAKQPLKSLRMRWEDNIKMDFREIGCEDGRCMELFQNCVTL